MMTFEEWWNNAKPKLALRELAEKGWNAALIEAEAELEKVFAEADTLNLLHGAARVRAMRSNAELRRAATED